MLKCDLEDILKKVDELRKSEYLDSCKECAGIIHSKEINDIWMNLFLLIINVCESSLKFGKDKDEKSVKVLEEYMDSIIGILGIDIIKDNAPELYKVGLNNYSPDLLVKMEDSDTLESIKVKILDVKKSL